MTDLPAEAWLSLTNEQRSELQALRRDNQLQEKAIGEPSTDQTEHPLTT